MTDSDFSAKVYLHNGYYFTLLIFSYFYLKGESIMFLLGEMIPKLKSRLSKGTTAEAVGQSNRKGKDKKKK